MAEARDTASVVLGGRYRLVERVAAGGMGEVWRARDDRMDRDVAVKLLRDDLAADPAAVERFRREARTAAALTHPNIASVYDVVDSGNPAIVMELVEGTTLADRIRSGPLPAEQAVAIGDAVLAALEAAHAAGVVHRDVTPGNVLLADDGRVKVTDFGIACTEQEGTRLTETGNVVGTAQYLAPEQLRDERPTPATDQYAAGLVLYETLTGARPFEAATPAAAAVARLHVPPRPLRDHRPEVRDALASVVMRALERDPARRFASVAEMRAALHAASVASAGAGATTATNLPAAAGTTAVMTNPLPVALGTPGNGQRQRRSQARREQREHGGRRVLVVLAVVALLLLLLVVVARATGGAATVAVRDVVGVHIDAATAALEADGLALEPTAVEGAEPEGTVLAQNIAPGTKVEEGTTIGVQVSSGVPPCCTMPGVEGLSLEDAEKALTDAGLVVGSVEGTKSDLPEGTVVEQDPVAGGTVDSGTAVNLLVAGEEDDDHRGRGRGRDGD